MGKRFEDLDRFLPPERAAGARGTAPELQSAGAPRMRSPVRSRRARVRRIARLFGAIAAIAFSVGSVAATMRISPSVDETARASAAGSAVDVRLGTGSVSDRRRPQSRREASHADRRRERAPLRYRRRLDVGAPASETTREGPSARSVRLDRSSRARSTPRESRRAAVPPQPPEPPQTPLFHCLSDPGNEHFVTIDRARAGQMSAPRSGWRCEVVGQVYAFDGVDRVPIELDDGTAYVLERRIPTEPRAELFPLYRQWAGSDYFYSHRQADGGLVGFAGR